MEWERTASGRAEVRHLFVNAADHVETRLVRFPAGSATGGAPELLGRDVLVVSGDFEADGERLEEGDFHRAVGASVSGRTKSGCVLLTVRENGSSAGTGEAPDVGSLEDAKTIRVDEGEWVELGPGARIKSLDEDPEHRVEIGIVRLEPGADYRSEREDGAEELVVIRGDCTCQGRRLGPGDFARLDGVVSGPDGASVSDHSARTEGGCDLARIARV